MNTFSTALLLLSAASAAPAQNLQIPDDVHASVRERVDNNLAPGIVVGIVDRSGTRYFSYGTTSRSGGQPVSENTGFEIGSVTKVFTALVLADMAVKGEVRFARTRRTWPGSSPPPWAW